MQALALPADDYQEQYNRVTEKVCLCEGLCASAYIKNDMLKPKESAAVAICPGPNLAFFSKTYSLEEMVKHIYGQADLLRNVQRPNLFVNELNLYIEHLRNDVSSHLKEWSEKKEKYLQKFNLQLQSAIGYYKNLLPQITNETQDYLNKMYTELIIAEKHLQALRNGLQLI